MKKLIVSVALLALVVPAVLLAGCGETKVPAGAIAAVGSGVVTQEQFDQIWTQAEAQYKSQQGAPPFPTEGTAQYNQLKASIVNYLVQNEIIKAKAADLGVSVTDKQLQERMKQIVAAGRRPEEAREAAQAAERDPGPARGPAPRADAAGRRAAEGLRRHQGQ